MVINRDNIRRLIPVAAVVGVLGFSLAAQTPSLASSTNNCGVKGYGYHDHGKVCPNRPFPGQGIGVLRILEKEGLAPSSSNLGVTTSERGTVKGKASGATAGNTAGQSGTADHDVAVGDGINSGKTNHGHGKGHAHGRANGNVEF